MAALFDPDRHEALAAGPWDAAAARAAIARIVAATRAAFTPEGLWPGHPNDAEMGPGPHRMLYTGAPGVIWALDHLAREGAAEPGPNFAEHLPQILIDNHASMAAIGFQTRGLLFGDAGVLLTQWKTGPSDAVREALADVIADNTNDPALELMWGAPGTMLAALALYRAEGGGRWADLYRAGADALEAALLPNADLGADIWTQELYGSRTPYLGPVHGFAGDAYALIQGRDLLEPDRWARLSARLARTLTATAMRGPQGVNWPPAVGRSDRMLAQHCHGAPGMVTALAGLDAPIDDLLLGAGGLTWAAGPLAKGSNLCHGTAGNGVAFLKLFERTGDALWLDRARAFAMHAIAQSDAEAATLGRRRYSLWTGDLGLACYLWECIGGTARFPTMDVM